ncbi:MAG: MBL fold metallo-hydrolase [Planctomycetes bacterium]|nr:MBL fold metallo-hydrolase [Planctomycetota bacterium]
MVFETMVCTACLTLAAEGPAPSKVSTPKGDILIRPIEHATLVLEWSGLAVYVDPVGGKDRFAGLPEPDVILVTDIHGDHLDPATVKALATKKTLVWSPKAVHEKLEKAGVTAKSLAALSNGEKAKTGEIEIEAVPMYNLTPERLKYHEKGRGNGYVVSFGGTRVYLSGDTEDIPEMRALKGITAAFVCMNLPYTMTVAQAASAVLDFKPKIVIPYHHRGQDVKKLKALVEEKSKEIEVRLLEWYPKKG